MSPPTLSLTAHSAVSAPVSFHSVFLDSLSDDASELADEQEDEETEDAELEGEDDEVLSDEDKDVEEEGEEEEEEVVDMDLILDEEAQEIVSSLLA